MSNWSVFLIRFLLLVSVIGTFTGCANLHNVKSAEPEKYILGENATDARYFYTRSGLRLFGQWWVPKDRPRAVILLVHGTVLHSGFYAPWANELTKNGYAVFGIDLRGWGQSQGYGRRGNVGNYDEYVEDVTLARREIRKRYPNIPVYLQGESLGGAVALLSHIMDRVTLDGLILNAPAVKISPFAQWNLWGAAQGAKMFPEMPSLPLFKSLTGLVLTDKDAQDRFWTDPFTTRKALGAGFVVALQDATERLQLNVNNVRAPMLVIQGTKDYVIPQSSSEFLIKEARSTDKTLTIINGLHHSTLHDRQKQEVWDDIISWLDKRADQALAARKLLPDETEISAADDQAPTLEKAAYRPKYPKLTMTTTRN
ncbi:MAG: lysophospholipase [Agitococcus sp.]|nr:lysophospholipase [Agitococcus sp.]